MGLLSQVLCAISVDLNALPSVTQTTAPVCYTLHPSCHLLTACVCFLFIKNIGNGPTVFLFMPVLPTTWHIWELHEACLPSHFLHSISDYLLYFVSIAQSHGHPQILSSRNHNSWVPLNPWLSVPLVLLICFHCRFSKLTKTSALSVFFFILIYHPFAISFSFSTQGGFIAS